MKCYICTKPANSIKPTGDFEHIECDSCGEYHITGTLVETLKINPDRTVDTKAMQEWLRAERKKGNELPMVSESNVKYK